MRPLIDRLDATIGDAIEATVRIKHRARLARLGQHQALAPEGPGGFARTGFPVREGSGLEVLIDGAEAFAAIAEAVSGATRFVHVAGWHFEPAFELVRGPHPVVLGTLLAEVAERIPVRVLAWAGSPVPAFHPTRSEVARGLAALCHDTRIQAQSDPREHPFHCHHEKLVIVDGEVAFVSGIDQTDFSGDRWDRPDHPARRRLGWHDVGTRLTGPVVADVAAHFATRWAELTGETLPPVPVPAPQPDGVRVQFCRTVCEGMYDALPHGEFGILEAYVRAIDAAERFIYLENQFLWSPEIVDRLVDKLRNPPRPDFRIVVLLPSKANNGQDDTKGQLGKLLEADDGHGRLLATTIRSRTGPRTDRLYVHAKVGIVDDTWMTIGSANLNGHSLLNDTEANVVTDDAELIVQTRARLWAEHLELDADTVAAEDPWTVIDERFRPIALEQLRRLRAGEPATHRLIALPGVSRRSRRLLGPLVGLLDDG